jgi:uncharacterized protein YjdB
VSSDPSIVTVDESGRATAHLPGTAEVYAEVSLDGTTAASKPVTIRVVASSK